MSKAIDESEQELRDKFKYLTLEVLTCLDLMRTITELILARGMNKDNIQKSIRDAEDRLEKLIEGFN